MAGTAEQQFQERVRNLDRLVAEIDGLPRGKAKDTVVEIVQEVLDLHGAGLEQALAIVRSHGEDGAGLVAALASDYQVKGLLLLHGLHPVPLQARVDAALQKVRPFLGKHAGDVEVLGLDEGILRLKLQGSCNGCASSALTLKNAIEQALNETAPDLIGIEVEGVVEEPLRSAQTGFIPITAIGPRPGRATHAYESCPADLEPLHASP